MKFDFKLAAKDKRLLLTILICVILVAAFIIFNKIDAQVDEVNDEIDKLQTVKNDVSEKYKQKSTYVGKTQIYDALYKEIINGYATGLDEQTTIMALVDFENRTNVWLSSAGFTAPSQSFTFGSISSTNPANEGAPVYTTDFTGYTSSTSLSYEGGYEEIKDLIYKINTSPIKYKIDTITMSYSEGEEIVNGAINLYNYAVKSANRYFPGTYVDGVNIGTENIFQSSTHSASEAGKNSLAVMAANHDVYLTLNNAASDADSMVMGIASDVTGESIVSCNSNSKETVKIKFTGSNGEYKVSYSIGINGSYPEDSEEGASIVVGDSLDFLIVGSPRMGTKDNSIAMVEIVNKTDMQLNVGVLNDDGTDPRCIISKREGNVVLVNE